MSASTISVPNVASKKTFAAVEGLDNYTPALPGIAQLLTCIVSKGDADLRGERPTDEESLWYNGVEPAAISVQDYLIRLCKYGMGTPEVYVHMVIYLGRLRARTGVDFQSYNIHRLMLTAFAVAAKLRDDRYYSNKYYARIGGVSVEDLNRMEQVFLTDCDWDLWVSEAEYAATEQRLVGAEQDRVATQQTKTTAVTAAQHVDPAAGADSSSGSMKHDAKPTRRRSTFDTISIPVKKLHNSFGSVLSRLKRSSTGSADNMQTSSPKIAA